jgi:hypothetical protein
VVLDIKGYGNYGTTNARETIARPASACNASGVVRAQ